MSRLYVCLWISVWCQQVFSQRRWLMLLITFCGGDLFSDLILWKGQLEILKKLWDLVDYTMSYFSFPEEVLPTKSRGQKRIPPNCQYPCRKAIWAGYWFRIQFEAKMVVMIQRWCDRVLASFHSCLKLCDTPDKAESKKASAHEINNWYQIPPCLIFNYTSKENYLKDVFPNYIQTEFLRTISCLKCFDILITYLFIYSISWIKEQNPHLALAN